MNRGRRRGRPGLTGLRDGVKRRLFDPHLVPIKPDAKYEVNRLTPLDYVKPSVESHLNQLRKSNIEQNESPEQSSTQPNRLVQNLFSTKAKMEIGFRNSRFYHPLPPTTEGIDIQRLFKGTVVSNEPEKKFTPLLSHLLLARRDIELSDDGQVFSDLEDPDDWYPVELAQFTKKSRKFEARRVRRKLSQEKPHPIQTQTTEDLKELVTDDFIQRAFEASDVVDDETTEKLVTKDTQDGKEDGGDSDDDRWNGEVKAAGDEDELDDEELENDYCQTYFDNGEGDLSDELNGDDDDGGTRYYD